MTEVPTIPEITETIPPAGEGKPNPVERMVEVITAPVATMRSIAARPDILVPLLTIVILSIVTSWLIAPRIDFVTEMRAQMAERKVPAQVVEQQIGFLEKSQQFMMPVMSALSPVFLAIIAGVLLLGFRLMGGGGDYKQAYSIVTYSWIPAMLKGLVATGIILMREDPLPASRLPSVVPTNLGFLFSPLENPTIYTLASAVDLVTIWMLILISLGFAFAARVSRAKSFAIVFVIWGVVVLARTGIAAVSSSMG